MKSRALEATENCLLEIKYSDIYIFIYHNEYSPTVLMPLSFATS